MPATKKWLPAPDLNRLPLNFEATIIHLEPRPWQCSVRPNIGIK